ncbi:MAG TPA: helix-hairpin-helix domain-containing protein, partial [Phnomibacter sp.]|nr:helix-hairpin-helix domain-containing protein [Phnomibacter sp.]
MRLLFIMIALLLAVCTSAQEVTNTNVEQALEDLAEAEELETEDDSYLQQLSQLRRSPLNLNTATLAELQIFRFLNELLLVQLINYRTLLGPLQTIYELQAVPGWDVETIQRILPYVRVGPAQSVVDDFRGRFTGGDHSIVFRVAQVWERSRGFTPDTLGNTRYLGSPQRFFFRYKYVYKNTLQFGIVGDKDPGEQFFRGAQRNGFDHYSIHLFARNLGFVKRLAIGDYTVNMGQGLLTYQSLAFRKSVDVLNIKRQTEIFRPYNSAGEFNFHRGGAITLGVKNWYLSAFVNSRRISATAQLASDTAEFDEFVSSLLINGLHRTELEASRRNNTREFGVGGSLQYRTPRLQFGANAVHYQLERPLIRQPLPYTMYQFSGSRLTGVSAEYGYTYKNVHLFGEMAMNPGGGKAMVHGLIAGVDRNVDVSLLYRKIDKDYHTIYGNAFTESITPINESGMFMGVTMRPWRHIRFDAYADVFRFPWLRYRVDRPSEGKDFLVQMTWKPNRQVEVYTRFRSETKALNYSLPNDPTKVTPDIPRQNWRTHIAYKVSQAVTLRARAEAVWWDKGGDEAEQGFMLFGDFFYRPWQKPYQ